MIAPQSPDLYILAFDHRTSFQKGLFGIPGAATASQHTTMAEAKELILDAVLDASQGLASENVAILVDEEIGASAARRARELGVTLAMCAERSSVEEFEFAYGDSFGEHIEAFDPDLVKVLVRYNPEGDQAMNDRQATRLAQISGWLFQRRQRLLFEMLVPPTADQLARVDGEHSTYNKQLRPELMVAAMAELYERGVEPDIWKVEGIEDPDDCRRVAEAARAGARDDVTCLVLGAGADAPTVASWLQAAAATPGYSGFAIGRTIWWTPLKRWLAGRASAAEARGAIAWNYRTTVEVFADARPTELASAGSARR